MNHREHPQRGIVTSAAHTRRLGVNIDHVATLRRLRDTPYPDLLEAARHVIAGGACQITVHLREDRRHIVDEDVVNLAAFLRSDYPKVDLNLEMAATEEMLRFALHVRPHSICLVPEKREERTTEGGLDVRSQKANADYLKTLTARARDAGILVSYFIEPDEQDIERSWELGAQAVELHTGTLCTVDQNYRSARASGEQQDLAQRLAQQWQRLRRAARHGEQAQLLVHAGHGIDYVIAPQLSAIAEIREFNIGHAIICQAVFCGLTKATAEMRQALGLH